MTSSDSPSAPTGKSGPSSSEISQAINLANSLRVTRDGFEFHVVYRTRFGETRTEKLSAALEAFQNMRMYLPHVNVQKSGIRLVVTRWDGETFLEEPGIENVEHASPDEVEALIKRNLLGASLQGTAPGSTAVQIARPQVISIEVAKKGHDARFHLNLKLDDGTVSEGLLLIRANMSKLNAESIFRQGITLGMTAMNDRIIIEDRAASTEGTAPRIINLPLTTQEEAKAVESHLIPLLAPPNQQIGPKISVTPSIEATPRRPPEPPTIVEKPAPVPPSPITRMLNEAKPSGGKSNDGVSVLTQLHQNAETSKTEEKASTNLDTAETKPSVVASGGWTVELLQTVRAENFEEINRCVFEAIAAKVGSHSQLNDHEFPAFNLIHEHGSGKTTQLEFVLAPHYLLCQSSLGYLRFGAEVRVYLKRLDDYIVYPHAGLLGVGATQSGNDLVFIITDELSRFIRVQSDKNYANQLGEFICTAKELLAGHDLLWPASREEKLFQLTTETAQAYGLPTSIGEVVLNPQAKEFIGFRRTDGHGIEFRDADAFVRFSPSGVEVEDDEISAKFQGRDVLLGWALDTSGRVCAIYREESGFVPPKETHLVRFLSDRDQGKEKDSLYILASLTD